MLCEEINPLHFNNWEAEAKKKKNEDCFVAATHSHKPASGLVSHPSAPPVYSSPCIAPWD